MAVNTLAKNSWKKLAIAFQHVLKKRGHQFEQRHIERKRYEWRLKA